MANHLVIVESPAKAKTIEKYLGKEYQVLASYGHVRDLQNKTGAVDTEHGFAMKYQLIEKNAKHVTAIKNALKNSDKLILATDPDREGEAIAWSVYELMKEYKALKNKAVERVVFYEITQSAIKEAITHPRDISMDLVEAQLARRALDYLVGFNLSPLLWKKVRRGLSAGRVQSPALRLIVEREEEIERFVSQEFWTIEADALASNQPFVAKLVEYEGNKLEQFSITQDTQANQIRDNLLHLAQGHLLVTDVEKKERKRNPFAPFITSTLQQEAIRKLGFTAQRAMRIAQQLYEGIDIGGGSVGLITYMRTDSVNIAEEAIREIRDFIDKRYGKNQLPQQARVFKTKSKNAQEAHEAIRPTSVWRVPSEIKASLTDEQYKLYDLIWKRTVACQMQNAVFDTVTVLLSCGKGNTFKATGSVITEPGFMAVYQEGKDETKKNEDTEEKLLPPMAVGDQVKLIEIRPEQHFTEPPPRYNEASLVKALEEFGIGRPSTYATIISTLLKREYVELDKKRFIPTDIGRVVNKFLTQYFTTYVDYDFTAKLEDELDAVSRGEKQWVPLLDEFWHPFRSKVGTIEETVKRSDVTQETIDEKCPQCGKELAIRLGKRGRFIGCKGYPECDYTRSVGENNQEDKETPQVLEGRQCPQCQAALQIKEGRYGKFIGCTQYPTCNYMESLLKPEDTGVQCPRCEKGSLLKRKSRRGKIFYSCSLYPSCEYALWDQPLAMPCPECHWKITTMKITKKNGTQRVCPQQNCQFSENYSTD